MITLDGSGDTQMIQRSEWGAAAPRYVTKFTAEFGSTAHWEGPGMPDFTHGACASYVRGIQSFHMRPVSQGGRGWSDIAYTAVVCPHGYVFQGRWIGNRTGANGTNIGNDSAYAVCYLGGEGDAFTPAADRAYHDTMTHLRRHGGAGPKVNCHRDWKPTACPGDRICGRVKSGAWNTNNQPPKPTPAPVPPSTEEDDMPKPLLLRLNPKDPAVLYMSSARTVHWVRSSEALQGYKYDMQMNGLSPDVCVLSAIDDSGQLEELHDFVVNLPFIGDWPTSGGKSTGVKEAWKGAHIPSQP